MTEIIPLTRARTGGPRGGRPAGDPATRAPRQLYVLFTDLEATLRAVRVAERLAPAFGGRVTVVHFRPVDFGAPLDAPAGISPAESEAFRERLEEAGGEVDVTVCVCRDARRALPSVIDPHSLVVVGGRHRWWPTAADRWRRMLEDDGYVVAFVNGAKEERPVDG
jgi:hypothetical protein